MSTVETGEEGETTLFSSRAKLYVLQDKQWKERGIGPFKLNVSYLDSADSSADTSNGHKKGLPKAPRARFLMRAEGSHRVVLNTPIKKEITVEDPAGGRPKNRGVIFLGYVDDGTGKGGGKMTMMQLKLKNPAAATELYEKVKEVQVDM